MPKISHLIPASEVSVAVYAIMSEPPSDVGAIHETVVELSSPSVADTPVGASGSVAGAGGSKSSANSPKLVTIGITNKLFPDLSITALSLTYIEKARPVPGF